MHQSQNRTYLAKQILRLLPGLEKFLSLGDNWDSYGAKPIEENIVGRVINFLGSAFVVSSVAPEIFPLSSGGIGIEWDTKNLSMEVEFLPKNELHYYVEFEGEIKEKTLLGDQLDEVLAYLRKI